MTENDILEQNCQIKQWYAGLALNPIVLNNSLNKSMSSINQIGNIIVM